MTFSIKDTQLNKINIMLSAVILSVVMLSVVMMVNVVMLCKLAINFCGI